MMMTEEIFWPAGTRVMDPHTRDCGVIDHYVVEYGDRVPVIRWDTDGPLTSFAWPLVNLGAERLGSGNE